ncbi:hypothetical protein Xen7305DRAFT_00031700 [Xenococcus sp. PCC 7305]|nr:hypothetical protein [Xenococcus sp. PCC 7305]ELS03446.1 hypothetical protein Xen7305DRAFT_00031700 [Xenococcus sp. PCC 7305]
MFAKALFSEMLSEYNCAIATYKGSLKKFFQAIAFNLQIPTEDGNDKPLTVDALKDEILENSGEDTLLILPEAKRLTTSIRYWLEDMMSAGVTVVCLAVVNPKKEIFLEMLEIELDLPSNAHIRSIMEAEAERQGLNLTKSQLAELQPLAGRNPLLARKVIRNEKLGIKQTSQHTQYLNIMPIFFAVMVFFTVLRFVGMGTRNKPLYIFGGVAVAGLMAAKQLGSIKGAQKRLGQ